MSKDTHGIDVGFTWDVLPEGCHVCLIFDSEAQRDAIVPEYLAAGLRQGELVRYWADETTPEVVRSWLSEAGVDAPDASESGPLLVARADGVYCPDGRFEPQRVIDKMAPGYDRARTAGFTGVRTCGEMTWALRGIPGSERLMEYEALLGTVSHAFPHVGMCQYDARRFDGATLFRVLQVHPFVVAGGQIVRNPYFMRPEDFLPQTQVHS
jgi:hypothetical protein